MDLAFCSFSSGSSGNGYFVKSDNTNILVEVGLSCVKIFENLKLFDVQPYKITGVVLSHEHWDHSRSLNRTSEVTTHASFYATKGTFESLTEKTARIDPERMKIIRSGDTFMIGEVQVSAFSLSHDAAEPVGFSFQRREAVKGSDLLVVEANHEENILLYGKYPYDLKRRILGDKGHLSNEAAAKCISDFLKTTDKKRIPRVLLAHMSQENNTPQQAMLTVRNLLEEDGYYVGKDLLLDTLEKGIMTDLIFI